jgi:hypothetical protein
MLSISRKPTPAEIRLGEEYLRQQQDIWRSANVPLASAAAKSFASLCQMLLSSNEFLYVG